MPHILLTNDDGYDAAGLKALAGVLEDSATVSIVAPNGEKSGAAQSLTLRQPIVVHPKGGRHWAVDGTPADAVIVALHRLLPEKPDLVISGINHGANMGENVYYSGTVGAAREAALHHIPSIAMSLCARKDNLNFVHAAKIARKAAEIILKEGLPDQVLLNINVPEPWNGRVKFTRQSRKITRNQLTEGKDPKGRTYYWIYEQKIEKDIEPDTDFHAVFAGETSVTPLHLDPTHDESLNHLSHWAKLLAGTFQKS
ncbi:MAG TPA: 5'/3'-nucleotidase SurE [Candidatus Acidoferrum sp.]|nr:5'/3'-nucleotidase SurE [Candidatus Acidoferrum sp.]